MNAVGKTISAIGLGAAAAPAYLVLGLSLGQAAASSALAALGCAVALLVPFPALRRDPIAQPASDALMGGHIEEALGTVAKLRQVARKVSDPRTCASLLKIAESAHAGLQSLGGRSLGAGPRRIVAYYLPQALRLAETARSLEALRQPRPDQVEAVAAMLARLEAIFDRFADDATAPETGDIERDLALLGDALDRDA